MRQHNMQKPWLLMLILCASLLPMSAVSSATEDPTYTISGHVYTSTGDPAGTTYVKVAGMESVISSDGTYSFPGVTAGEHVARAYFMNDGHTVAYRTIFVSGDMTVDWHEGHNWITADALDANGVKHTGDGDFTVHLHEAGETLSSTNGRVEFGPYATGQYHTVSTNLNGGEGMDLVSHLKLQAGSASFPYVNHLTFQDGKNSVFGFLNDSVGNPATEILVAAGDVETTTNADGFYALNGLTIGEDATITFSQAGQSVAPNITHSVDYGAMWVNQTSTVELNFPENASFITTATSVPIGPVMLEWEGGAYTDHYELYVGEMTEENLLYRGYQTSFEYDATESGTYEFHLMAFNTNGTSPASASVLILVLGNQQASADGWSSGMHWNYSLLHNPEYHQNKTFTAIGTETITDAFGRERSTYLIRVTDDNYEEGEKAFRWIDTETYLPVKTYWVDAPSSSSYYTEATMGWNFNTEGEEASLHGGSSGMSMHFNRTNIIGVPGHPNGYDDTFNTVTFEEGVVMTTAAGTFTCTYIVITDEKDGVHSWELWYNETVQNYVKIVDRLPGSHSDSVVYELTGYDRPSTPQFLTEAGKQSASSFELQWAEFPGAQAYQLMENGVEVYRGDSTTFNARNRADGDYLYQINAIMGLDYVLPGTQIEVNVDFVPPLPEVSINPGTIAHDGEVTVSWSYPFEVEWYALTVQSPDGTTTEMYNGSSDFVEIGELEPGLNRIRVSAMVNGKLSEPSDSVFVTVDEAPPSPSPDAYSSPLPSLSFVSVLFVVLSVAFLAGRRRDL